MVEEINYYSPKVKPFAVCIAAESGAAQLRLLTTNRVANCAIAMSL